MGGRPFFRGGFSGLNWYTQIPLDPFWRKVQKKNLLAVFFFWAIVTLVFFFLGHPVCVCFNNPWVDPLTLLPFVLSGMGNQQFCYPCRHKYTP